MEEYAGVELADALTDRQLSAAVWLAGVERGARRELSDHLSGAEREVIARARVEYRAGRCAMGRYALTVCDVVCYGVPLRERLVDLAAGLDRLADRLCMPVDSATPLPA